MVATELLQRARRADPLAGVWEAADVQWAWRKPRQSDEVDTLFWFDDEGPVAGVVLTSWADEPWQCDPIVIPGASDPEPAEVFARAVEHAATFSPDGFDVPVGDDDKVFTHSAQSSALVRGHQDNTGWLDVANRPPLVTPAEGFVIVDRTQRQGTPHHMRHRNGERVAERLAECPLYDPELDLAVEGIGGQFAGNSLYWFDPSTRTGLVEPVGVEDEYRRRGLARAMLCAGIDRLATRGAERVKISWESEAAGALYLGIGFRQTSTTTWWRGSAG